jgi:hypothetical protein
LVIKKLKNKPLLETMDNELSVAVKADKVVVSCKWVKIEVYHDAKIITMKRKPRGLSGNARKLFLAKSSRLISKINKTAFKNIVPEDFAIITLPESADRWYGYLLIDLRIRDEAALCLFRKVNDHVEYYMITRQELQHFFSLRDFNKIDGNVLEAISFNQLRGSNLFGVNIDTPFASFYSMVGKIRDTGTPMLLVEVKNFEFHMNIAAEMAGKSFAERYNRYRSSVMGERVSLKHNRLLSFAQFVRGFIRRYRSKQLNDLDMQLLPYYEELITEMNALGFRTKEEILNIEFVPIRTFSRIKSATSVNFS